MNSRGGIASMVQSKLIRRQQLRTHLTPRMVLARAGARAGRFEVPYEHIPYVWHSDKVCNNTCQKSYTLRVVHTPNGPALQTVLWRLA